MVPCRRRLPRYGRHARLATRHYARSRDRAGATGRPMGPAVRPARVRGRPRGRGVHLTWRAGAEAHGPRGTTLADRPADATAAEHGTDRWLVGSGTRPGLSRPGQPVH